MKRAVDLKSAAATIFALTAVLPLLLFLFFLWRFELLGETETQVGLLLALLVALLGFVIFQRLVGRIVELAEVLRAGPAEVQSPLSAAGTLVPGLGQVTEISDIAKTFGQLLEDLRSSTDRLEDLVFKLGSLSEMVDLAAKIPRIQDLLDLVLERSMRTVRAGVGSIMLLDAERRKLQVVVTRGATEIPVGAEVPVGEGIAGRVVQLGEPTLVEDIETDPRFAKPSDPKYNGGSFMCMPLRVGTRIIGVVNLAKKESPGVGGAPRAAFSPSDLQFLTALMTYTAYAVDNARLLEEAQQGARRLREVVEDQQVRLTLAQQQAIQAAKLAAMGQLLAGVAHELNNPLSVVTGHAEVLLATLGETAPAQRAQKILDAADRCARIVKTFLALARQRAPERKPVELNAIVREAVDLLAHQLELDQIEVGLELGENLPVFGADRHQLNQVLINLISNARHAMRGEPLPRRLHIGTRFDADRERVCLVVGDTGPGIPPDIQPRVFEPFFTTRPEGQGTGLGLSLCQGIVESHGGSIHVESPPGRGAVFQVELPVGSLPVVADEPEPLEPLPPVGPATILVVDDEAEVADLLADLLRVEGYDVDTAGNGSIALDRLRDRRYDLVVSDIRMPQLDGPGLYREARRRGLDVPFVFLTGDSLSLESRAFIETCGAPSLTKPLKAEEVHRLVRRALHARR